MTVGKVGAGLRILVIGAGIAGLGAARALRERGFAPDLVEQNLTWADPGAALYLPGNAARALRVLGLESAIIERGSLIPYQRLCDHRGRLLATIDLAALWAGVGPCLAVHRSDLHQVLALHGEPVPIRMGRKVQRLNQHEDAITVEFGDGTADDYDLIIGADGIHSTTRQLAAGNSAVRPVGQLAWRFVTECPPEVTTWTAMLGRDVSFLAVPIGRGRVYCYCDATTDGIPQLHGSDITSQLAELLSGFAPPVPAILQALGPTGAVHVAPIEEVCLDRWSYGLALLIGDAAHATSPNMAEGAAMALEDGLVLAECLSSEPDLAQAMAQFQIRRRPRTQWVLTQTHRRDRTRNLPPALRNLVLRLWARNIFRANYRPLLQLP
jgi:FAD-dependent urate hydroxylase